MSTGARQRPALMHLYWWFLFSQGGVIAALLIPVHVLIQGILGPLGVVRVVDRHYDTWVQVLGNPIVKLYLLVLIAVPFFHLKRSPPASWATPAFSSPTPTGALVWSSIPYATSTAI
ncbi:MAG: hypothetical protein AUI15_24255 [Actinobacteria bacterium 13_2_20CM_2_66_6]|nr:MAG: hypothetical protein AUI15_24255 [Actinobacteria bacterium 13_2_20CM_2_66_6]